MVKALVVYATTYGNTKKLADSIVDGAKSVEGTEVILLEAEEAKAEHLLNADAIIIGSPVHMGSADWKIKRFIDDVCSHLWMKNAINGKIGGVFTTGSGYGSAGGGCELTMLGILSNMAELGLIMVPLPKNTPGYQFGGLQWGPYARSASPTMEQTGISKESLTCAFHHGANIVRVAKALKGVKFFAS